MPDQKGRFLQRPAFSTEENGPGKSDFLKTHLDGGFFPSA